MSPRFRRRFGKRVSRLLKLADLPEDGQTILFDGEPEKLFIKSNGGDDLYAEASPPG
jgi:hypothetical protein